MLKQKIERDDNSKKSHLALANCGPLPLVPMRVSPIGQDGIRETKIGAAGGRGPRCYSPTSLLMTSPNNSQRSPLNFLS